MHKEYFENKRRDEFLEKMKHLYDSKDGTEPELQDVIAMETYTTRCAMKIYILLQLEENKVSKEILRKLNALFSK